MAGRGRLQDIGYGALVALLVTATLSAGAVLYQLFGQVGHVHAGAPPSSSAVAVVVDTAGFAMMFLLGAQLMTGYRLVDVKRARFRHVHVRTAWAVVGLLAFHAVAAVLHTFEGIELLPVILDLMGLGLLGLVAAQLSSGYGQGPARGSRPRVVHATLAVALVLLVAGHSVIGILHTLRG